MSVTPGSGEFVTVTEYPDPIVTLLLSDINQTNEAMEALLARGIVIKGNQKVVRK